MVLKGFDAPCEIDPRLGSKTQDIIDGTEIRFREEIQCNRKKVLFLKLTCD